MVKKKKRTVLKYPIHIFLENFRTSMENKYTLKFKFAIEIQIELFTLVLVTSNLNFHANIFQLNVLLYVVI